MSQNRIKIWGRYCITDLESSFLNEWNVNVLDK
jgi:hypothetical protein